MLRRLPKASPVQVSQRHGRNFHTSAVRLSSEQKQNDAPESWKKIAQKELGKDPLEKLFRKTPEVCVSTCARMLLTM